MNNKLKAEKNLKLKKYIIEYLRTIIIGIIIGVIIGVFIMYKASPNIGSLMVSFEDITGEPYLFLDLKSMEPIYKKTYVTLKVDLKTCNPQK